MNNFVNPRSPNPHSIRWIMGPAPPPIAAPATAAEHDLRLAMGQRIKSLRSQQDLTQKELAAKLGIHPAQLNKYESGLHTPPIDKLVYLTEILKTSLDYLVTGGATDAQPLHSFRLLDRFRIAQDFGSEDQEALIRLLDAMIASHRTKSALVPVDRPTRAPAAKVKPNKR